MVAGALISTAATIAAAEQADQRGRAKQAVAEQQAKAIQLQGKQDELDKRKELSRTLASIKASGSASGIMLTGVGTIGKSQDEAKAEAARQISLSRHNAAIGVADKRISGQQAAKQGRARASELRMRAGANLLDRGANIGG